MATLICPECAARFQCDEAKLHTFTKFRCKRCKAIAPIKGNIIVNASSEQDKHPSISDWQKKPELSQQLSPDAHETASPSSPESSIEEHAPLEHGFALAEHMLAQLEKNEDIETIFTREGVVIEVRGNRPLSLNTEEFIWLVNEGTIDIFSIQLEQGKAVGSRKHLLRLEPGKLFTGIDIAAHERTRGLIAVGSIGSSVLQLKKTQVKQLAESNEFSAIGISTLIEQWIASLMIWFRKDMIPKDCQILSAQSGEVHFDAQVTYKAHKGVIWVRHRDGSSIFLGNSQLAKLPKNTYFPVDEKTWLHTCEPTHVVYTDSLELIKQKLFWESLEQFNLFIADSLSLIFEQEVFFEKGRLKRKFEDEKISFKSALTTLLSVINPQQKIFNEDTADPLLSACKAIGNILRIPIIPHPEAQRGRNSLEDIARASRVRIRQIILKGTWWHQDNGPLLAFTTDKTPIALLPTSAKSYLALNPGEKTQTKVTAKIAELFEGHAYTFYTPFPEHALTWRDLLKLGLRGIGGDLTTVLLMGIFGALLGLLTPVVTGILFDSIIPGAELDQLYAVGMILFVCASVTAIFEITKGIAMLRIEGKVDFTLQAAIWDRLLSLSTPFFRRYTAGDLAVRSLGINGIRQVMAGVTLQSLLTAIFSLVYLGLLIYYDWFLTKVAIGISLVSFLLTLGLGYLYVRHQKPMNEIEGKLSGLILQLITGISKLRISGTEDRGFAVWAKEFSQQRTSNLKSRKVQNWLITVNALIPVCASMIFYYFILSRISNPLERCLTTGSLLAFLSAYGTFQGNLLQMSGALLSTLSIVPLYERLTPIITERPEVDATKTHPGEITGDIEVTQIHFRYKPDGPLILHNVSLNISSGEFIALVGGSGSGKSTLMRLLLGFETPEAGSIYYNGQDLFKIDVLEVRRQIGVVLQNAQIMAGSIYENIVGAGAAGLTVTDAWEAARMAGCEEDIQAMPMGLHTVLPPGGGTLSGGQRQRIIIARAIVRKPRILFFDEATSALDNKTQSIVSESIEQLQATRIVIAHRLSTIMNADKIYVMDKGVLVQSGTYNELMKQKGVFADLAKRQMT